MGSMKLSLPLFCLALTLPTLAQSVSWQGTGGRSGIAPGPRVHVIYVDADATGAADGSSWADAFPDLTSALAVAAAGDQVWVAEGVYTPSTNDASVSFVLASGVEWYGGFSGVETSLDQRDPALHVTRLSGDIGQDDVVGSGPGWYLNWDIGTPNSGHVIDASGVDSSALVDGFVIADGSLGPAGTTAGQPPMWGGGIYAIGGSPTVRNCTFTHHEAAWAMGAGIYVQDGTPLIEDCLFLENYVHSGDGAGIAITGAGSATVRRCTFRYGICVATQPSGAMGGGIQFDGDGVIRVEDSLFESNTCKSFYWIGDTLGYGGGLGAWGQVDVARCTFIGNRAHYGGGLLTFKGGAVEDCLFAGNYADVLPNDPYPEGGGYGAGVVVYSYYPATLTVHDTTVADNHGKKYVGLVSLAGGGHLVVENCIVRDNQATHPEVVGTWKEQLGGSFDLAYSDVNHIFDPPGVGEDPFNPSDIPGCIDADPLFVAPANWDYHLGAGSPCIDAGDNARVPVGVTLDLDGLPRFVDDPTVPDTGSGSAPLVDMGATERQ